MQRIAATSAANQAADWETVRRVPGRYAILGVGIGFIHMEGGRVIAEAVGIVAGVLTLALLYRLFFSNAEELVDAIVYWFTPDAWSFFRGRLVEDWFASFKLGLWIAIGGFVGFGVYAAVADAIAAG